MARFYLGIDGGQSSTKALLADEAGRVIGRGRGGPCNHVASSEGRAKFFGAVGACLEQACQEAGLSATPKFGSICLGLSGGTDDKEAYTRELIASERYKFTHDAEIALIGATAGRPGIIVIAGTGSIAFGRNQDLKTARAGGWGYLFGDEGGGVDLAKQAVRRALQFEEGWGPATILRKALLEVSGAPSINALMHQIYNKLDRKQFAGYARLVSAAAEQKDEVALEVLKDAAGHLSRYIEGVHQQLFEKRKVVQIVRVGGVFESHLFTQFLAEKVYASLDCPLGQPRLSPAAGALLEALRLDKNLSELSDLKPGD